MTDPTAPCGIALDAATWVDKLKPALGLRAHASQIAASDDSAAPLVAHFVATHGLDRDAGSVRGLYVRRSHFPVVPAAAALDAAAVLSHVIQRVIVLTSDLDGPTVAPKATVDAADESASARASDGRSPMTDETKRPMKASLAAMQHAMRERREACERERERGTATPM